MTIKDYANLPENLDGFWIEKIDSIYPYLGYYRGCQTIAMTVSATKEALRNLYAASLVRRNYAIAARCPQGQIKCH